MATIVISEFLDEAALPLVPARHRVVYDKGLVDRPADLIAAVAEASALIVRNRTPVRGALLEAARHLRVVGRLGVGLDNIDVAACAARGIPVLPATGANDIAVAEWVIGSMLVLLRGAFGASTDVAAGGWPRQRLMGREAAGKVLGLVGVGAIAREVARRAQALGMAVVGFDPFAPDAAFAAAGVQRHGLEPLLREADVVSLHVPLTDDTRGMFDALRLARMKPHALLLNAARGGIVDEAALASALREGPLGGAALDVFEEEPLTAARGAVFAGCPNLILTPHVAGVTVESNARVSAVTVTRVVDALAEMGL